MNHALQVPRAGTRAVVTMFILHRATDPMCFLLQKHVGHVHHERRLHRLMMKDELRVFEGEFSKFNPPSLPSSDAAIQPTSDGRMSSSGSLTAATIAASRSIPGSMTLSSARGGPGNNSGRSGTGKDEDMANVHVTLASSEPSQVRINNDSKSHA